MESNTETLTCSQCAQVLNPRGVYCTNCGFPEGGSDDERRSFLLRVSSRKRLLTDAQRKIKNAKIALIVIGAFYMLVALLYVFAYDDAATAIANAFVGILYFILVVWCERQPFTSILTGFVIYISFIIISVIIDPVTLVQGILIKIIIVAALIRGIYSAREARRLMKELEVMKA